MFKTMSWSDSGPHLDIGCERVGRDIGSCQVIDRPIVNCKACYVAGLLSISLIDFDRHQYAQHLLAVAMSVRRATAWDHTEGKIQPILQMLD